MPWSENAAQSAGVHRYHAIYVGFDQIEDEKIRDEFLNLPTRFRLEKEKVDKLRAIGPKILDQSRGFEDLCSVLKCHEE